MLALPGKKREALELRKEGLSLNEIAQQLSVSKGTVSVWVRGVKVPEERRKELLRRSWMNGRKKERGTVSKHWNEESVKKLSTQDKGNIAEVAVLFRLSLRKIRVFGSPFDGDRTDWLVETSGG